MSLSDRSIRSIAFNSALCFAVIGEPSTSFKFLFKLDRCSCCNDFNNLSSAAPNRPVNVFSKTACFISAPILKAALPYWVPSAKANCSKTPLNASISSFRASRCCPESSGYSLAKEASIAIRTGSLVLPPAVGFASGFLGAASSFAINSCNCSLVSIVPISCKRLIISLNPCASLAAFAFSETVVTVPRTIPISPILSFNSNAKG